jgi:hypothetical protein
MGMAEILTQPRYLNASRMSKFGGRLSADIRQARDLAYVAIRGRGHDHYRELADDNVAAVLVEFEDIGMDPEKFSAFLSRVS